MFYNVGDGKNSGNAEICTLCCVKVLHTGASAVSGAI